MKISKITNWLVAGAACLLLGTSCDVDPTFYSQVVPDTYYTNAHAVWFALLIVLLRIGVGG